MPWTVLATSRCAPLNTATREPQARDSRRADCDLAQPLRRTMSAGDAVRECLEVPQAHGATTVAAQCPPANDSAGSQDKSVNKLNTHDLKQARPCGHELRHATRPSPASNGLLCLTEHVDIAEEHDCGKEPCGLSCEFDLARFGQMCQAPSHGLRRAGRLCTPRTPIRATPRSTNLWPPQRSPSRITAQCQGPTPAREHAPARSGQGNMPPQAPVWGVCSAGRPPKCKATGPKIRLGASIGLRAESLHGLCSELCRRKPAVTHSSAQELQQRCCRGTRRRKKMLERCSKRARQSAPRRTGRGRQPRQMLEK